MQIMNELFKTNYFIISLFKKNHFITYFLSKNKLLYGPHIKRLIMNIYLKNIYIGLLKNLFIWVY